MTDFLKHVLSPNVVAVLGASDDPLKPGGRVIDYMMRYQYAGTVYPISKGKSQVQGIEAYQSLDELPTLPDLVVIALPEALILDSILAAARAGAKAVVIFASGYAELGDSGRQAQERIAALARDHGLRVIGPNTQGFANFSTGAVAHFGTIIDQIRPDPSPIGIVSQSGAGSQILYTRLNDLGLGAKYLVATGNEADVDIADVVAGYATDDTLKLILVYAESIKSPDRFLQACQEALRHGKPVLMVKSGRTQSGQKTAASHTGALASEDRLVDAFLERCGVVRLADFEELAQVSQFFLCATGGGGRRIISISNSGATCVLSADAIEEFGLNLIEFDEAFKAQLSTVLPSFITPGNPIDMTTATLKNPDLFKQILDRIAATGNTDLVYVGFPMGGKGYDFDRYARELKAFSDATQIPVAVSVNQDWAANTFRRHTIPVFSSERRAISGLCALSMFHERKLQVASQGSAILCASSRSTGRPVQLSEVDSLQRLHQHGLPIVEHHVCHSANEVIDRWHRMGSGKVVLKGVSETVAHKSEQGLVRVGLQTEQDLRDACGSLLEILHSQSEAHPRLMLARYEPADFELMIGIHHDPQFGAVIALGQGGVLVELIDDMQFMLLPVTAEEVNQRIHRLTVSRAFKATRGLPAVDIEALTGLVVRLSDLVSSGQLAIDSLDMNPIRLRRGDHSPVIVDALAYLTGSEVES